MYTVKVDSAKDNCHDFIICSVLFKHVVPFGTVVFYFATHATKNVIV